MKSATIFKRPVKDKNIYGKIHMIHVSRIYPNPAQPRKDFEDDRIMQLAESIMRYGILQPLSVRFAGEAGEKCCDPSLACFELIAGERRLRAAKIAGLREVPCLIIDADCKRSAELALIENIQRQDLNIFEQAGAISSLIDMYGITQEQAARVVGSSQSAIANKIRLLKLTTAERKLILENRLTERHARALLRLTDPGERLSVLRDIIHEDMNVSQAEAFIDKIICPEGRSDNDTVAKHRIVIKDIRLFYNTLDRAIDTIEKAGINVAKEKRESDDAVEFVIKISKRLA